jgi:hypothetical protein
VPDELPAPEPLAVAEPLAPGPAVIPAPGKGGRSALKVVTVYLEQGDDEFLETITHAGRTSRPKIAVSRRAVVRLALERAPGSAGCR